MNSRLSIMDLEADEYCAPEGGGIHRQALAANDAAARWEADGEEIWALGWHSFLFAAGVVIFTLVMGFALWKFANRVPAKVMPVGVITSAVVEGGLA